METSAQARFSAEERNNVALHHYQVSVRKFLSRRISAQWDVEDLVQESVSRFIFANRRTNVERPIGYLFQIARNLLVDHARRDAAAIPMVATSQEELQVSVRADQEDALHLADLKNALDDALDELPVKCREVFILRRFHNMDTGSISDRMNISHRMVQKYLLRSMEHLRQRLAASEDAA